MDMSIYCNAYGCNPKHGVKQSTPSGRLPLATFRPPEGWRYSDRLKNPEVPFMQLGNVDLKCGDG